MCQKCYYPDTSIENRKGKWGANGILRKVDGGVYICTCSIQSSDYHIKTKHVSVYDSYLKPLHQPKCWGDLIHNRTGSHICVLDDNDREF